MSYLWTRNICIRKDSRDLNAWERKGEGDGGGVWAGRYRDDVVRARYKNGKAVPSVHHSAAGEYIRRLCEENNEDVTLVQRTGVIDPITLAARSTHLNPLRQNPPSLRSQRKASSVDN